ncbi:hypothetical protein SDC9_161090 [bioreactor metagenome]|uniref:Uncharacterized protein n=1 Tax=bioreactor metagenome TaxID=1076179 RepID=A0A645FN63_9ZZZZ
MGLVQELSDRSLKRIVRMNGGQRSFGILSIQGRRMVYGRDKPGFGQVDPKVGSASQNDFFIGVIAPDQVIETFSFQLPFFFLQGLLLLEDEGIQHAGMLKRDDVIVWKVGQGFYFHHQVGVSSAVDVYRNRQKVRCAVRKIQGAAAERTESAKIGSSLL